jgi:hypothetical protein
MNVYSCPLLKDGNELAFPVLHIPFAQYKIVPGAHNFSSVFHLSNPSADSCAFANDLKPTLSTAILECSHLPAFIAILMFIIVIIVARYIVLTLSNLSPTHHSCLLPSYVRRMYWVNYLGASKSTTYFQAE